MTESVRILSNTIAFSMTARLLQWLTALPEARSVWRRFPIGSVDLRTRYGAWSRPHYAYGVFHAAKQAKHLNIGAISVIEFGVAAGRGLVALQDMAQEIGRAFSIDIRTFGFDTGHGMPAPSDYKDLPHVWGRGFYNMDQQQLQKRLSRSTKLVLGDVQSTISEVVPEMPRIGFVAFDLDYYSSTKRSFSIFDFPHTTRLPRVYCYFDDIFWPEWACHNEHVGELCAIREFNDEHKDLKLSPLHMLRNMRPHPEDWNEQMYVLHDFAHPFYCTNLTVHEKCSTEKPL